MSIMPQNLNTKILIARTLSSPRSSEISSTLTNAFDDLERIARRSNSFDTASSTHVAAANGVVVGRTIKGVEMQEGENEHLDAEQ